MKNTKNNKITDYFENPIFKIIMTVYIVAVSAFISYLTSKVYYEMLWPNERTAVVIFMTISILIPYFYMLFTKVSGFKTVLLYHFILIFTAVIMLMPYEYRPYIAIVMLTVFFTNLSVGIVTNAGICGFAFFSMASEPEFFFTIIMLLTGTFSCLMASRGSKKIIKYSGALALVVFNMILNGVFRIYCDEVYIEYEKISFIFVGTLGCIIGVLVYLTVELVYERFIEKGTSPYALKQMTQENYKPLKYLKSKSISTYYHSKEVADIAKECAKKIGADEYIAYVGGLYHEIGKVFGSDYVNEGVAFAKKNQFPREIVDIIAGHNIKFGVAKSKECAIILMIDTGINAYNYYSSKKADEFEAKDIFEKAIMSRLVAGYLDKSGITIEEYNKIVKTIIDAREKKVEALGGKNGD